MSRLGKDRRKKKWCLWHTHIFGRLEAPPSDIRPRAFPLWLLAPRLLRAVLFLATAPCSALARAPLLLGRGRFLSPASGSSSQRWFRFCSALFYSSFCRVLRHIVCAFGVHPRTTPLLHFILVFTVSLSLFSRIASAGDGAHIRSCHSGNARGLRHVHLTHPTHSRVRRAPKKEKQKIKFKIRFFRILRLYQFYQLV